MAGWKPIGSIYDTIRKRWFGPGDVFHKGDWLPRLYAREFEHTDEEPNVPEQSSIPTPPPPSSGGSDPRVDQLLRDVAELKAAPPGSGQDPRVEGLLDRVATVEGKATRNAEGLVSARQVASEAKAVADGLASGVEQAAAKAQAATEAASAATAKATQVVDAANQAKLKAEDAVAKAGQAEAAAAQAGNKAEAASVNAMSAAQSVQGLQGKVQAAEAAAGRAEAKAGEAESTALSARSTASTATTLANMAKRVTDKLGPLKIDETYNEVRANVTLAKEAANNAQIIAQGASDKVDSVSGRIEGIVDHVAEKLNISAVLFREVKVRETVPQSSFPDGFLFFVPRGAQPGEYKELTFGQKSGSGGGVVRVPAGGMLVNNFNGTMFTHLASGVSGHYSYTGDIKNQSSAVFDVYEYKIVPTEN